MGDQSQTQFDRNLPPELVACSRWLVYRKETHEGRIAKVPYNARTGKRADPTNPDDWSSFDVALEAAPRYDGLGLAIGPPFCAVDLDKCRNPETGELDAWAKELIDSLPATYAEVSPSGRGVHLWFRAVMPKGGKKGYRAADLELYFGDRYFTVTGVPL